MPRIAIPASIEEAKKTLTGLGALLIAKEWERAAIVYAFTVPGTRGGNTSIPSSGDGRVTPTAFAKHGITGLKSDMTVRAYRKAWSDAIAKGKAVEVKPGDKVTLPSLTWTEVYVAPPVGHAGPTEVERAKAVIEKNPGLVRDFMEQHPDEAARVVRKVIGTKPESIVKDIVKAASVLPAVSEAIANAVVDDAHLSTEVHRKTFAKSIGGKDSGPATPTTIPSFDRDKEVMKAIDVVSKALDDEKADEYTPIAGMSVLYSILRDKLNDRDARIAAAQPEVHEDIEDFLASNRNAS